jgi:hypothetical protein
MRRRLAAAVRVLGVCRLIAKGLLSTALLVLAFPRNRNRLKRHYGAKYKPLAAELLQFLKSNDPFAYPGSQEVPAPYLYELEVHDILRDIHGADSPAAIAHAIHARMEDAASLLPPERRPDHRDEAYYMGIATSLWRIIGGNGLTAERA